MEKSRKDQIKEEYSILMSKLGDQVFRTLIPYLEIADNAMQALRLARENRKITDSESVPPKNDKIE